MHFLISFLFFHAIYISVIEMEIKNDIVTEMQVKVFADDIADALRAESGKIIDDTGVYDEIELGLVEQYFRKHLYLKNKDESKFFTLISSSKEDQAVWLQFLMKDPIDNEDILIGDYLIEIFPTQRNMIRLNQDGDQKFIQISNSQKEIRLLN